MGEDPDRIRAEIEQTRAEMGETVDALGYKTDVKARATEGPRESGVKDRVVGRDARHRRRQAAGAPRQERRRGEPARARHRRVAVGFLAGMLIPSTRVEDEKLGSLSDDVIERAKETGQEALERGKQVAQDAAATAKESGREHAEELKSTAPGSRPRGRRAAET